MKRQKRSKMMVIGVTGSFGSGKSTVAGYFGDYGLKVIDADKIGHQLLSKDALIRDKITRAFGRDILNEEARICRRSLARVVFSDKTALLKLNRIMHPEIIRIIKREIKKSHRKDIILDAPLLIEAGLKRTVDKLVVVKASREKQIERVRNKTGLRRSDILKRIGLQAPLRKKLCAADFIIDNSGTKKETKNQVEAIRRMLWRS